MRKHSELIKAYAEGKEIECNHLIWGEDTWINLTMMQNSAIRVFLCIDDDPDWSFRIKE